MLLNLKLHNSNTAMKTRNIKAEAISVNSDDELSLCIELIGKNQDKSAFGTVFRYFAPRLKSFLVKAGSQTAKLRKLFKRL